MTPNPAGWNEQDLAETPAVALLQSLGYTFVPPEDLERERASLKEAVLTGRLAAALKRLNPWLSDTNVARAVKAVTQVPAAGLAEANQALHTSLTYGIALEQDRGDGRKSHTVRFLDFDDPGRNEWIVTRQYRVLGSKKHVVPDVVAFVNGLPLAVVECKSPTIGDAWKAEAVKQLRRYQEAGTRWKDQGAPRLFEAAQILIGACGERAVYGTVGTPERFFLEWKEPYSLSVKQLGRKLGRAPTPQDVLLYGLLEPRNLLDVVRNFVVFEVEGGRTVRKLARYKQFVAVNEAMRRIRTARKPGARGGIVWHTQGSGKSLTMLWLALKLRRDESQRQPAIVIVTDRTKLDRQIAGVFTACGFPNPERAASVRSLRRLLEHPTGRTVITTIQKFQELAGAGGIGGTGGSGGAVGAGRATERAADHPAPPTAAASGRNARRSSADQTTARPPPPPVAATASGRSARQSPAERTTAHPTLSEAANVFVLVDEAHRTQYRSLAANMRRALPNACFLGFTGTPIDKQDRSTLRTFGPYIDTYTIEQAVRDGATVPIFYESRLPELRIIGQTIDRVFDRVFAERTDEERAAIRRRYATEQAIAGAPRRIEAICLDLIDHFTRYIAPNRFKAQVVAASRHDAVTFKETLDRLNAPESAVIMSAGHNDEERLARWHRGREQQDRLIGRFKDRDDPLSILVVCDMLLTGFDAPVEQVMYLDAPLREHGLLQAIARVNRPCGAEKTYGLVVDYRGVSTRLQEALAVFSTTDVRGALTPNVDELPRLESRHAAAMRFFLPPAGERSAIGRPAADRSAIDRSAIDRPAAGQPAADRSAIDRPVADRSAADRPATDRPVADRSAADRPAIDRSAINRPGADRPAIGRSAIDRPVTDRPAIDRSAADRSVTDQPGADTNDLDACVRVLEPEDVRAGFDLAFRRFSRSMDMLLPDPRALAYRGDLQWLGKIRGAARARYRDERLDLSGCGEKVRTLIAGAVAADGIEILAREVRLFSPEFEEKIDALGTDDAKASEMEHAIRHEINVRVEENPAFYQSLREKLEAIIEERRLERLDAARQLSLLDGLREEMQGERTLAQGVGLGARGFAIYGLLERRLPERQRRERQRLEGYLPGRRVSEGQRLEGRSPGRRVSEGQRLEGRSPERHMAEQQRPEGQLPERQRLEGHSPERHMSEQERPERHLPERHMSEQQRLAPRSPERHQSPPSQPMAVGEEAAAYDVAAGNAHDRDPASLVDLASRIDEEVAPFTELVDWWQKDDMQREMRKKIKRRLRDARVDADAVESLAADIVDLARVRSDR